MGLSPFPQSANVPPFVHREISPLRPAVPSIMGPGMIKSQPKNPGNRPRHLAVLRFAVLLAIPVILITTSSGCINQLAGLLYVIKGHKVAPQFEGLEGKRVAVLCVSDASAYGPDTLTYTLSKRVSMKIAQGVKQVEVISPARIEDWIDQNGWEESNVVSLGQAIGAEMLVVIEVASYSIHEGATIYKGNVDLTVSVYDIAKQGQVSFVYGPERYSFPENGRPSIQSSDRQFESFFLARLTDHISRLFVAYDKMESFADEAMMN